MTSRLERTLVLLKPDAIQRQLCGRIIQRFEDAGYKIIGVKMVWMDQDFCKKHYFDVAERRGEKVFKNLLQYITHGPVLALCIEGVDAVENVRKMTGATEPKSAPAGTIRGDFSHHSFDYTDSADKSIRNLIHASGSSKDALYELSIWFSDDELHSYKTVHEVHTL